MAQEMMVRQERQRTRISRTLQDDLAQTLLGINVHLLLLKTRAGLGKRELIGDIVKAQRMVDTTASSVRRAMQRIRRP
jgi:signal transduction histidine kinase